MYGKAPVFGAFFRLEKPIRLGVYAQTLRPLRSKGVVSTPSCNFATLNYNQSLYSATESDAMPYAILRTAKLKTVGNIIGSLSHNYRTRETPNADPEREADNFHQIKTQKDAAEAIRKRIPTKHRKDAVLCIEYMITASPEFFQNEFAEAAYFDVAHQWLKDKHGAENVVTVSIHADESTPHMVAYVVPVDEHGKLNAKKFLGGREKLSQMQTDFANHVKGLGLERGIKGSKAKHTSIKEYYARIQKELSPSEIPSFDIPDYKQGQSAKDYGQEVTLTVFEQIKNKYKTMEMQRDSSIEKAKDAENRFYYVTQKYDDIVTCLDAVPDSHAKELRQKVSEFALAESNQIQEQIQREKDDEDLMHFHMLREYVDDYERKNPNQELIFPEGEHSSLELLEYFAKQEKEAESSKISEQEAMMNFIFTRDSYIRQNLSNGYGRQLRDLLTERSEKLKNPTHTEKLELLQQAIRDIEEVKAQKSQDYDNSPSPF